MIFKILLAITFSFYYSCNNFEFAEKENSGGILLVGNEITLITSVVLIEKDLEIPLTSDGYFKIESISPGTYSLLLKNKNTTIVVKDIHVTTDSLSIFPLGYLQENKNTTISWKSLHDKLNLKVKNIAGNSYASISGKVFESNTHLPIYDAVVSLVDYPWWGTKTDKNGHFCIDKIYPGLSSSLKIFADHPDFHRETIQKIRLFNNTTSIVDFFLGPLMIPESPIIRDWDSVTVKGICGD